MSITIHQQPSILNPVFNTLPVVTSSTNSTKTDFNFIYQVYIEDELIQEYKPYVNTSGVGFADISKSLGNYLSKDNNYSITGSSECNNSLKKYSLNVGEEFSRKVLYSGLTQNDTPISGYTQINCEKPHFLRYDDRVYIQKDDINTTNLTNTFYNVTSIVDDYSFVIEHYYTATTVEESGYFIESIKFYDNSGDFALNKIGFMTTSDPRLNVGDTIVVQQDAGYTYGYYNATWKVLAINKEIVGNSIVYQTVVDADIKGSTPAEGGTFYALNKYRFEDVQSINYPKYVYNGTEQYEDFPEYNYSKFIITGTSSEFFTNSPSIIPITVDGYATLSTIKTPTSNPEFYDKNNLIDNDLWSSNAYITIDNNVFSYGKFVPGSETITLTNTGYTTTAGIKYAISYEIEQIFGCGVRIDIGGVQGYNQTTTGLYFEDITSTGGTITLNINKTSFSAAIISNLKINQYVNDGLQSIFDSFQVKTYTNNTLINTYTRSLPEYSTTNRVDIGVGPMNLTGVSFTNIDKYTVNLGISGTSYTAKSETKSYEIISSCSGYENFNFIFLNRVGGFDYYTFRKNNSKTTTINRSTFNKNLDSLTNNNYAYSLGDRSTRIYDINANDSYTVYSDFLTDEEAVWLQELFTSPEVYIYKDGKLIPVIITNSEIIEGRNADSLVIYSISFEMPKKVIQRY